MAKAPEDSDQGCAHESVGPCDERGCRCGDWHGTSVECGDTGEHPQQSHSARTELVRPWGSYDRDGTIRQAMKSGTARSFGAQLKAFREAAGFTQEELATIAGLSVHAVSALERGERRRPHVETVRALSVALDLSGATRDALLSSARASAPVSAFEELTAAVLPLPLTVLLGRDKDLEVLQEWLAEPGARLITLIGPGGVGKSRLALELARLVADHGKLRVLFTSLATIWDPGLAACAIAEALGLADLTAADLPKRARAACDGQQTLLLVDNFEQVLSAAPVIAELLATVPTLRLLVTSRAPLHVKGEREYAVGPLELDTADEGMAPADLAHVPAIRLFLERVRDVEPAFSLTVANGRTIAEICRRLDGMPLALELAAPWMRVLPADDLLRRLENDVLLSPVSLRDLPARQQTMNATLAWSYQLLGPDGQRAFRRLSALPARFSIDAAAAVLAGRDDAAGGDEGLAAVAGLIDKSLLSHAETSRAGRSLYQMFETVRAYAMRELTAAGERDEALAGLVRYCTAEASRAESGLAGRAQVEWLNRVHDDLDSYRGALTWLIEHRRGAEAAAIAWGLLLFWVIRSHAAEALSWYEEILNLSVPPPARSRALVGGALMWLMKAEPARGRSMLIEARALAHSVGDMYLVAHAEALLGRVENIAGNVSAASDHFVQAVETFETLGIHWGAGSAMTGWANLALATDDAAHAQRLLDGATAMLRDAGPWCLTSVLCLRAVLAVQRGNPGDAISLIRESLMRIQELQDKFAFVYAVVPLAQAAALTGDDAWAARILGVGDAVSERTGATISGRLMHDRQQTVAREVRARLGPERWDQAYAAGRKTSIDALLKDIDGARV